MIPKSPITKYVPILAKFFLVNFPYKAATANIAAAIKNVQIGLEYYQNNK